MTPLEYATAIVVPTIREALQARHDRRSIYLACIVTYHLVDYLARSPGQSADTVCAAMRCVCEPAFDVVQGVCNGTKHARNDRGRFSFDPGTDRDVPIFAFDSPGAGWEQGRWNVPGLAVQVDSGELILDACVQVVIRVFVRLYPAELGGLDLSWIDPGL